MIALLANLTMPLHIQRFMEEQVLVQKVAGMALNIHLQVKEYLYVDIRINLITLLLITLQLHFITCKNGDLNPHSLYNHRPP